MKKFEKQYIGKGTKVADLEIVTVVLKMDDAQEHIFEIEGNRYLKFEISKLRETDKYGRTHTCYVSKLVEQVDEGDMKTLPEQTEAERRVNDLVGKKGRRKSKKAAVQSDKELVDYQNEES